MRVAPFGQIEISVPESAVQRANRKRSRQRRWPQRASRRPWNVFGPHALGAGYPGPELFSRNPDAVGSP